MTAPVRLQRSRRKGFNLQAHSLATNGLPAVNVARPSKWGNPFDWQEWLDDAKSFPRELPYADDRKRWCCVQAVDEYENWISGRGEPHDPTPPPLSEIRGLSRKNLACWCEVGGTWACHADVLLDLAKRPVCEEA